MSQLFAALWEFFKSGLLLLAGIKESRIHHNPMYEDVRRKGLILGGLMFIAAMVNCVMFTFFVYRSLGLHLLVFILPPILLVFNLFLEASIMLNGSKILVWIRMVLLIIMAFVNSIAYKLEIFKPDMERMNDRIRREANVVFMQEIAGLQSEGKARVEELRNQIDQLTQTAGEAEIVASKEERGLNIISKNLGFYSTGEVGVGDATRRLRTLANESRQKADSLRERLIEVRADFEKRAAMAEEKKKQLYETQTAKSMLVDYVAMKRLMNSPDPETRGGVWELFWIISLIFILLEIFPLLVRAFQKDKSSYEMELETDENFLKTIARYKSDLLKKWIASVVKNAKEEDGRSFQEKMEEFDEQVRQAKNGSANNTTNDNAQSGDTSHSDNTDDPSNAL